MAYFPNAKTKGMLYSAARASGAAAFFFFATCFSSLFADEAQAPAEPASYSVTSARERGAFDIGPATGGVSLTKDGQTQREVLKFDFAAYPKSHTGVWTKKYPRGLRAPKVDAVKVGVNVPDGALLKQVTVKVEIKGKKAWQAFPLNLRPGWNYFNQALSWDGIGDLNEVVFVVSPIIATGSAEGILLFDLDFFKLSFLQKYAVFVKIGWVLALGLLLSVLAALLGGKKLAVKAPAWTGIKRDILYGVTAVLLGGAAFHLYGLGNGNPLDIGFTWDFLFFALLGAGLSGLLKLGLTGKNLTAGECLRDAVLSGLLAAGVSNLEILHAPASWAQLFQVNKIMAVLAFLVYHLANAGALATSGKHLRAVPGLLLAGTPFLLNLLMVTEDVAFVQSSLGMLTGGLLASQPWIWEILSRFLIVFLFNEIFVNGIGLVTKGDALGSFKSHGLIALVSLGVALSPLVADLGSTTGVAGLPAVVSMLVVIATTALAFGGLWGQVYLITGVALDGGHRMAPTEESLWIHVRTGVNKGITYSAILLLLLFGLHFLLHWPLAQKVMAAWPVALGVLAGALSFPFFKTIIETFDGSLPFFQRVRYSYQDKTLMARGAVVGFGFGYALSHGMIQQPMPDRTLFGLGIGVMASSGVSLLRDIVYAARNQGQVQSWRLYLVDGFLGAFVGVATAFYLDARQVPVIVEKFNLYTSTGFEAKEYTTYPLLNKWGRIDLGAYTGGGELLYTESLAGVINWSIAAWLFAVNKVFLQALFERQWTPIKFFFSKEGFAQLTEHMIYVLRWGLWMSPIIFTFLRMMPDPTWYNQDGAIRTLFAVYHDATSSPEAFRQWSLNVFVGIMAYDFFRVLIWMDHMGLRVATLVNLSFIGMDKLDEKIGKFIGPASAQRYIPEGVKRFTTWGPLLIPFFLPRGAEWDYVWNTAEAMQNAGRAAQGGWMAGFLALGLPLQLALGLGAVAIATGLSALLRALRRRSRNKRLQAYSLANRDYRVFLKENGEIYSEVDHHKRTVYPPEYDITRRSYDFMDPCGRLLYVVDSSSAQPKNWPVIGNFPQDRFAPSTVRREEDALVVENTAHGVKTNIEITLPERRANAEIWTITLENLSAEAKRLKIVPYLEWVLNGGLHDRFHTQYSRLFPEMEYIGASNALLAWQKSTKSMGFVAADTPPEGVCISRMDFIGRAQSVWAPRLLETMAFDPAQDAPPCPSFEPIGSLLIGASLQPKAKKTIRLMIGYAKNRDTALSMIQKLLKPQKAMAAATAPAPQTKPAGLKIGHGEILPGTPQPYSEFLDRGNKLLVHTPYTPRPYDHALSNALHSVMVTNRGLHTSCNGNSQQNRLTPDWPDTVTKEVPAEAIYLFEEESKEWFSPTYHPLNQKDAAYESEFGVDGTAVFRMQRGQVSTELTVFVPPSDPLGVYLLTVKNNSNAAKKIRVSPFFQMVLEFQPERSGWLQQRRAGNALYFKNPRNIFRSGWAFAALSETAVASETLRGRYFGAGRGAMHPYLVEQGRPDASEQKDTRQIASFLSTLSIPAHGEHTMAIVLGQTDGMQDAKRLVAKYTDVSAVRKSLEETRAWWTGLMQTLSVETSDRAFDHMQNWLKYQALAERIWARRGFYQTSGAYGFRDQLQDTVNLMWMDPALARKQILLHASQQFPEGDVFHWFFTLTDGRTAFSCRSHASDNPAWLPWAVVEYLRATGDSSILDEKTSYVWSEFPFADLPKNQGGWGHLYHRTTRADTVYRHCLKSLDLILDKRTGKHGLPLIRTGDWNDGLDEIGSHGKGESVWLGFFVYYILKELLPVIEQKDGAKRKAHYQTKLMELAAALERTWREDRYLRAIHDDGTEIGVKNSGIWETDALTAAWAVMADIHFEHGLTAFNTALKVLERGNTVLLGWPALREDTKPYLGRSSKYPEGVRENGMYCHGVQWLVRGARILAEKFEQKGDAVRAAQFRETAYRLWLKISPIAHVEGPEIELYGGQPNKQAADMLTTYDQGRMIWHGYTGAAGWMLRQAFEGVVGAQLIKNQVVLPKDLNAPRGNLQVGRVLRDVRVSPLANSNGRLLLRDAMQGAHAPNQVSAIYSGQDTAGK